MILIYAEHVSEEQTQTLIKREEKVSLYFNHKAPWTI